MEHIEALKKVVGADLARYSNEHNTAVTLYRWSHSWDEAPFATCHLDSEYFFELIAELCDEYHWAVRPFVNTPLSHDTNLMDPEEVLGTNLVEAC